MPNLSLQELVFLFKIINYLMGVIGIIIVLSGGVIAYIYKSDRKQNATEHGNLFKRTEYHGEEISELKTEIKNAVKNFDRLQDKHDMIHK